MSKVMDHLGNTFNSKAEMCKAYGISQQTLYGRLKTGYSLKEALTMPIKSKKNKLTAPSHITINADGTVIDHLGRRYSSLDVLKRIHNID